MPGLITLQEKQLVEGFKQTFWTLLAGLEAGLVVLSLPLPLLALLTPDTVALLQ